MVRSPRCAGLSLSAVRPSLAGRGPRTAPLLLGRKVTCPSWCFPVSSAEEQCVRLFFTDTMAFGKHFRILSEIRDFFIAPSGHNTTGECGPRADTADLQAGPSGTGCLPVGVCPCSHVKSGSPQVTVRAQWPRPGPPACWLFGYKRTRRSSLMQTHRGTSTVLFMRIQSLASLSYFILSAKPSYSQLFPGGDPVTRSVPGTLIFCGGQPEGAPCSGFIRVWGRGGN